MPKVIALFFFRKKQANNFRFNVGKFYRF